MNAQITNIRKIISDCDKAKENLRKNLINPDSTEDSQSVKELLDEIRNIDKRRSELESSLPLTLDLIAELHKNAIEYLSNVGIQLNVPQDQQFLAGIRTSKVLKKKLVSL